MDCDDIPVDGQNVGNQQARRNLTLIAVQGRSPLNLDGFPSANIQVINLTISAEGKGRLLMVRIQVDTDWDLFRQYKMHQPKRICQGRNEVFASFDAVIQQLQFEESEVDHDSKEPRIL